MFLVIDGSSILSSCYYGTLPIAYSKAKTKEERTEAAKQILHTSSGVYTNGIYGSLNIILNILKDHPEISHLAVVFDKTRNTFRRQISKEYKANRKPTPNLLSMQFHHLMSICDAIGIPSLVSDTFEADDLAGSIIARFHDSQQMVFLTKDHDYLQMIDDNVTGWILTNSQKQADAIMNRDNLPAEKRNLPAKTALFQSSTVYNEEGVYPFQIPDKKGLCGDSSDNIPGVAGIGPTTALPLLQDFYTIENIYQAIDTYPYPLENLQKEWQQKYKITKARFQKIVDGKANALMSKQLATIAVNAPVPHKLDSYQRNINKTQLQQVLDTYEMPSLRHFLTEL